MISPKVATTRWLLLCVLAFGLIGMHHLGWMSHPCGAPADSMPSMSGLMPDNATSTLPPPTGQPDLSTDHRTLHAVDDLLHLCLAVLVAGLVLVGLWALLRSSTRSPDERLPLPAPRRQPPHPPPVLVSPLTSLGVLRL